MPAPYCLAMVLCDSVHRDLTTGKFTVLGTFSTLGAQEFPADVRFAVYYAVTDGLGSIELRLRLVDAACGIASAVGEQEGVVFQASATLELSDPLVVVEGSVGFQTVIPAKGLYHCELWAGDELLMSRRLLASLVGNPQEEDKDDKGASDE